MNDSFSIFAPGWYGWQMNPGYFGERCVPYFSPIHVTRVTPLKTGKGILEIDFWNVCYAEGVCLGGRRSSGGTVIDLMGRSSDSGSMNGVSI